MEEPEYNTNEANCPYCKHKNFDDSLGNTVTCENCKKFYICEDDTILKLKFIKLILFI